MDARMRRRATATALWLATGSLTTATLLAGCSARRDGTGGTPVDLDAFVIAPSADPSAAGGATPDAGAGSDDASSGGSVLGARGPEIAEPAGPSGATPGPAAASTRRMRAGDSFVIDALVGQINGRPIFAEEFFEPIGDQLRAIGRQSTTQTAFVQAAGPIVREQLKRRVDQALYLAEAESSLSPEERQGLRFWLAEIQNVTVARRGGSRAEADRRLRTTENRTLEEEVQRQRDEGLQSKLIRDEILPRIIVSKYEIEREYLRRFDEFNPPPATRIDRILVRNADADALASVADRLAAGESIRRIAADMVADGTARRSELGTFALRPADIATTEDEMSDRLREYAADWKTLGDWTGPIAGSRSTSWFFVAEVVEAEGRPIFDEDVQRILKNELRNRKLREELTRYEDRLRQDSILSQEQEMLSTLLDIALRRYGPR